MRQWTLGFLCLVLLVAGSADYAHAEKRVALVVGNSYYTQAPVLKNPANDAADMAAALKGLGFEVIEGRDLTQGQMRETVRRFGEALEGADVALFFYAGHGLQVAGQNYLAPVDAKLRREGDLDFDTVRLELVLRQMEREARTSIVFLDACRDNPLARSLARSMGTRSASVGRGLAQVEAGIGSYIAFATQPGNVALDGEGRNSPFTSALVKHIAAQGKDLGSMMIAVRNDVLATTQGKQVPWEHSSLTGQFYFKPGAAAQQADDGQSSEDLAALKERLARLEAELEARAQTRDETEKEQKVQPAGTQEPVSGRSAKAIFEEGKAAHVAKRFDDAARLFRKAADLGDPGAMTRLGYMYAYGEGLPKDTSEAVRLYHKAAELGEGAAMSNLGRRYYWGDGVPKNDSEAFKWYRKSAEAGNADGMFGLAYMYSGGRGVAKDEAEAVRWYRKSAELGLTTAMFNLGRRYEHGRGVARDEAEAMRWFRKAAEKGDASAMGGLGAMYGSGRGVAKDATEAARWYQKAVEKGDATSMTSLGHAYQLGNGVPKDLQRAAELYKQAVEKGQVTAKNNLGILYDRGEGVPRDSERAAILLLDAYRGGDTYAKSTLEGGGRAVTLETRRAIQRQLRAEAGYTGAIDGKFGPGVMRALRAFAEKR